MAKQWGKHKSTISRELKCNQPPPGCYCGQTIAEMKYKARRLRGCLLDIENSNGRLRRDFPRYSDIKNRRKDDFDESFDDYNLAPRKKLNWDDPIQAFNKNLHRVSRQT